MASGARARQSAVGALCCLAVVSSGSSALAEESGPALRREVRQPGRTTIGIGVGVFDVVGFAAHARAGIMPSRSMVFELGLDAGAAGFINGGLTSVTVSSSAVFLGDTFFQRLGVARREVRTFGLGGTAEARDVGFLAGIGNRWDGHAMFLTADWLSVYVPVLPLSFRETRNEGREDESTEHSRRYFGLPDLRIANVTFGVAF
jgi:hypothetical protein